MSRVLLSILLFIPIITWGCGRFINSVQFDQNGGGNLKRAADANTVELAKEELGKAIAYFEQRQLTSGYTSIVYHTPDEDLEFWYKNLKAAYGELETVQPYTTQLERTNVLMKLRETLLDNTGEGTSVTLPQGISIYPYNGFYMLWAIFGGILAAVGSLIILEP